MKQAFQTLIEFLIMSITVFGLLYIEVIAYGFILFKEYAIKVICGC